MKSRTKGYIQFLQLSKMYPYTSYYRQPPERECVDFRMKYRRKNWGIILEGVMVVLIRFSEWMVLAWCHHFNWECVHLHCFHRPLDQSENPTYLLALRKKCASFGLRICVPQCWGPQAKLELAWSTGIIPWQVALGLCREGLGLAGKSACK
jgi:hypothetical protein